ncbi:MAG: hypothetical protein JW902_11500 [Syntrophaceae bacterium]|nr:hypothetical protein [Syntrophaceae bacterium]
MGKLENSFALMRASWEVLKKDKEILFIPIISGITMMILVASFLLPIFLVQDPALIKRLMQEDPDSFMMMSFVFYFLSYLIIIFFNSAIVACATIRMAGGDPTVLDGINAACSRIFRIISWALVSASVGIILRMIQGRSNFLGRAITGLLGMAWSAASYLVVPILVSENKGPFSALGDSVALLKRTWGEGLIGTFSFGLVFTLMSMPVVFVVAAGAYSGKGALTLFLIAAAAVYLVVLSVFQSALQGIFQAALYQFARFGNVPLGFREEQLRRALDRKE